MKNFQMGQKSPRNSYAQKFAQILSIILIMSAMSFSAKAGNPATPSDCPSVMLEQVALNEWTVTITLGCAIGGGEVNTISQWSGDSYSDATTTTSSSITYHFFSTGSSLPTSADVAIITLTDDDCGENHSWQVSTDGGGTMLILDEF